MNTTRKSKKIAGIFHYDLDGVACAIVLDRVYHFDTIYRGGYGKIQSFVDNVTNDPEERLAVIVADVSLTLEQYEALREKTKGSVLVIDHHPDTAKLKEAYPNEGVLYDDSICGAKACYEFLKDYKVLDPMAVFVDYVNAYDLYQRTQEPWVFSKGFDYNLLFWHYHFDDFMTNFYDGQTEFTKEQRAIVTKKKNEISESIAKSPREVLEGDRLKSLVIICDNPSIINEVPYHITDYDTYFMITKYPSNIGVSVRSGLSGRTVNTFCAEIEKEAAVDSSGGHEVACGITMKPGVSDHAVLDVIMKYHNMLDKSDKK